MLLTPFYSFYEWLYLPTQPQYGTRASPPDTGPKVEALSRTSESDEDFVLIRKEDLTERERPVISSQLACPDETQFVRLLSDSFRDLTLGKELMKGANF